MKTIEGEGPVPHIAVFLPTLEGGGAEKVMVTLINGFCRRGLRVDVVLAKAAGAYLTQLAPQARVVNLDVSRVLLALGPLTQYLKRARPVALLSAMDHCNVIALLASKLSGARTRVAISVHSNFSSNNANSDSIRARLARHWVRPFYHRADAIVAVSSGVADDLCTSLALDRARVKVIYNPVVTPELFRLAAAEVDHSWFGSAEIPLILGVGRLTLAKDFDTLIRAFAMLRAQRPARLLILGEGEERPALEARIRELGLEPHVELAGFVDNPFRFMRAASLFVLSSRWEGFGNVLAEALACGVAVVSTDCPSGPAEILEQGRWGALVPVGDADALAGAMLVQLGKAQSPHAQAASSARFGEERIIDQYLAALLPSAAP